MQRHTLIDLEFEPQPRDASVVRLTGRLDLLSANEVKHRLSEAIADGHRRLVVDLAGVPFIDSSGLGALIGALKAARLAGGDLRIAGPTDQARVILQLTTLDRVLCPYASVAEALSDY